MYEECSPRAWHPRERADVRNTILSDRVERLLPRIMSETGIDAWVVAGREYNEDPVLKTLLPAPMLSARRRTILVFRLRDSGDVEASGVCRYGLGSIYRDAWDPGAENDWECAARLIGEMNPRKIGVNLSEDFGLADGMTFTELRSFKSALTPELRDRLVSAEQLAVRWLETRTPGEMEIYPGIVKTSHRLIAEAFSDRVVTPGKTTAEDLTWWFRKEILELGLDAWFHPTVRIQSPDCGWEDNAKTAIDRGDLLHCDLGISHLGLCSDTQQHAYVLPRGAAHIPAGIGDLMGQANHLQDIVAAEFETGRTGNEILRASLGRARSEGIHGKVYTHPIGFHGHAAGTPIGMWDKQDGVEGAGERPIYPDTCYALELSVTGDVPEWGGRETRVALEEVTYFDGSDLHFLAARQVTPHIIG